MNAGQRLHYQPEIDGLRALAVLPVILFHAGISAFSGGFVGVDIFFVISGYLITGIIAADLDRGTFTIANFYQRRVRRILPALFVVILASLIAGLLLFLPEQLTRLAQSALSAIGFASNIWLWAHAGYFMGDSRMFPLLHTWSLSLEEQFYIFFPPLMMAIARWKLPRLAIVLALLAGSLALAAVGAYAKPSATFYFLPTRAWELMLGAAIALGVVRTVTSAIAREAMGWAGIALLVVPVLTYSDRTVFPGLAAIPPCIGAAMLIVAGRDGGCQVTNLLASRPMVGIGLISYSLYLWHWPLFVFARQVTLEVDLAAPVIAMCIAASFVLAIATWQWVERPFRDRQRMTGRRLMMWVGGGALAIVGVAVAAGDGMPGRMTPETLRLAAAKQSGSTLTEACNARSADAAPCRLGAAAQAPSFAVWGDSHAGALGEAFDAIGRRHGRAGLLYPFGGCPGLIDPTTEKILRTDASICRARSRWVLNALLADRAIRDVVLVDYWQAYDAEPQAFADSLKQTVAALRQGGKQVTIIAGIPAPGFDQPWGLAMANEFGLRPPEAEDDFAPSANMRAIGQQSGVRLIDLSTALCPDRPCSRMIGNRPMFSDSNHLSREAVVTIVSPALQQAGALDDGQKPQLLP